MHNEDRPVVHTREIAELRPTQMTVGLRDVACKRASWRAMKEANNGDFLGNHIIPVVIGPKDCAYIIDNHHLARALYDEGVTQVLVPPIAQLHTLAQDEFWTFIANRNWLRLYDGLGMLCSTKDLPMTINEAGDDLYRWCYQTNANSSQFPSPGYVLGCKETAPLGESDGMVPLEILPTGESALRVEQVVN